MSEPAHDAELAALQAALTRFAPAPDGINLARLLFRAGQASASRRGWAWPCATVAALVLAAVLGGVLVLRPGPLPVERTVFVQVERPAPPAESPAARQPAGSGAEATPAGGDRPPEGDYLTLRRQVLAHGVDALPAPARWPSARQPSNLDTLLGLPPGAADEPWLLRRKNALPSGDAS
jgi:hypothetical protein